LIDGLIWSAPIIEEQIKGGRMGLNAPSDAVAKDLLARLACVK
jgi:hypothetical protein